ncbi:MAG: Gx transporter family protein, partial [Spirochaetaceae bacterium]|nr:Gx transporter family protein [Spirochaetaceae bacterium]
MDDAKNTWEVRKEAESLPVLGALCLFLSVVEYMLPKPLPFIRLGLANAPLLLALRLPPSAFFTLVLVKIFGQAFISGTLFSYVFLLSLSGTAFSASVMYVLRLAAPEKYISLVGISVSGAVVSNIIQITLARLFILGPGAMYIVPPVLGMGIVSGAALGLFCERFAAESRWYRGDAVEEDADFTPPRARTAGSSKKVLFDTEKLPPEPLFFAGVFMSAAMLFTNGLFIRAALFFVFFSAAALAGKCGNLLRT